MAKRTKVLSPAGGEGKSVTRRALAEVQLVVEAYPRLFAALRGLIMPQESYLPKARTTSYEHGNLTQQIRAEILKHKSTG
jgi:hypothetical protein